MSISDINRQQVVDFLGYIDLELNLSDNTIAAYRRDISEFIEFLGQKQEISLNSVRESEIIEYLLRLRRRGISARSAARKLSALRHLFRFLVSEGKQAGDPTNVLDTPKLMRPLPDILSKEEIGRLIEAISGDDPLTVRNRAIMEFWYACGLRISELSAIKTGDIVLEVEILRVHGKGGKQRLVPFGSYARRAYLDYLHNARDSLVRDNSYDILFLSRRGGRLSRMGLWNIFAKYLKTAGIRKKVTPHSLRHSCATHMVENGADIRTVMEFLGHADISTTQIYTHLDQRYLKEVHRRCHPRKKQDAQGSSTHTGLDTESKGRKDPGEGSL